MTELIAVGSIDPNPWQPRTSEDPEHIEKIARSIAADDLMQPPVVRLWGAARYELAFGHTRHKAFLWLRENFAAQGLPNRYEGYSLMPVEVRELTDEAMFRQAVSENISRKDLNAIEEAAAMKRALDEFKYTSAQVGALFGKNEATVRGTIRLLDLPKEAQGLLGRGEISQNAARVILSMQRVASADVVGPAVRAIRERSEQETPEHVVKRFIDSNSRAVRLWDDGIGGKALVGGSDGWPLELKKFPNEHLVALKPTDLIAVLDIQNERTKELVSTVRGDGAVELLMQGWEVSEIAGERELAAKLKVLIDPPSCTACPLYTKIGGVHYCGLRACYNRKQKAWGAELLERYAKQTQKTVQPQAITVAESASESSDEETDSEGADEELHREVEAVFSAPTLVTPPATPAAPVKPANPLLDDPYEFDKCTITVQLTMLPDDGNALGREVIVGARNHADPYLMRFVRLGELTLPDEIIFLLDELQEQLPARGLAKAIRDAEANKK